eukprot:4059384-Prymnesium_polylepis.2
MSLLYTVCANYSRNEPPDTRPHPAPRPTASPPRAPRISLRSESASLALPPAVLCNQFVLLTPACSGLLATYEKTAQTDVVLSLCPSDLEQTSSLEKTGRSCPCWRPAEGERRTVCADWRAVRSVLQALSVVCVSCDARVCACSCVRAAA